MDESIIAVKWVILFGVIGLFVFTVLKANRRDIAELSVLSLVVSIFSYAIFLIPNQFLFVYSGIGSFALSITSAVLLTTKIGRAEFMKPLGCIRLIGRSLIIWVSLCVTVTLTVAFVIPVALFVIFPIGVIIEGLLGNYP